MTRYSIIAFVVVISACASPNQTTASEAPKSTATPPTAIASVSAPLTSTPSSTRPSPSQESRDGAAIFAKVKPALVRCYEDGKKSTPTMLDGRLTLNASIGVDGKATCVIPTLDTGLTQEVEDCMSARFGDSSFGASANATPWSVSLPLVLRNGALDFNAAAPTDSTGMDSIETTRMFDAFEVIEALEPEIATCMRGTDKNSLGVRSFLVAARVGLDGRNQCALTSSPSRLPLPAKIGDCLTGLLRRTKFPPPKGGPGLVLIPIHLVR